MIVEQKKSLAYETSCVDYSVVHLGAMAGVQSKNLKHVDSILDKAATVCIEDQLKYVTITGDPFAGADENSIFQVVEERPQFPGGDVALMKYLQDSLRYPAICMEQQLQGRVIVQFVVNPDSTISDAQVIKPVNPHFDKEALRVVYAMPKWSPGKLHGKPVRVRFTVPVTFRLEGAEKGGGCERSVKF